ANSWNVSFDNGNQEIYKGVIICNGHHWDKKHPDLPNQFTGEYLHAKDYKDPSQLKNKKVLIIGSGNSAADIACECARVADLSVLNFNSSPWIFPKSFMGIPLGRLKIKRCPGFLSPFLIKLLLRISFGKHSYYNLDTPTHKPFDKHPTISEELPSYLKHGRIITKKGIKDISNKTVRFTDDSSYDFDLMVAATGYKLSFPFLPKSLIRTEDKNLHCIGHCVYPDYKGLFFMGWQQIRGGVGSLASAFSKVIVDLIIVEEKSGLPAGLVLQAMNNKISSTHLYGAKDIYSWIRKHNIKSISKISSKMQSKYVHNNLPTGEINPNSDFSMNVF
ncbi:NAD(P)/FAD-dependent oxidoreductase, partial [bacterium]